MENANQRVIPFGELDEPQAIQLAKAGTREGFEWLLRRHVNAVFGFLVRWLGDRQLAEEAFQDAAVCANRSIHHLEIGRPFRPWFFRIAVNRAKTHLETIARTASAPLEHEHGATPSLANRLEAKSTLERALEQIRPTDRQLLLLRFGEELSIAEVADIVDAPPLVVQMRVSRARKRFRAAVSAIEREVE